MSVAQHLALLLFALGGTAPVSLSSGGFPPPYLSCITGSLPQGVVGGDYRSRVVMVYAKAPVVMTMTGLPPGVGFDAHTGCIFGRPTESGEFAVEVSATDGYDTAVSSGLVLAVSAPTGPLPAALVVDALPDGRVGVPYAADLAADVGVGPMVFGADELPPGLTLLGRTGEVRGTPTAAGTWFVAVTVHDVGANTLTGKDVALVVDPPGSSFRFVTRGLNAEGGFFYDRILTSGAAGPVTFGGDGSIFFVLDPVTGATGGPIDYVAYGSGRARVTASDGTDTIETSLPQLLLPSDGMYFDFDSLPAAFVGIDYGLDPPVSVAARNAPVGTTYSAQNLPWGMACDQATGVLTGRPLQSGSYDLRIVADAGEQHPDGVIHFSQRFLVLPPGGGDASAPVSNYWSFAQELHPGMDLDASWAGLAIWNADRRMGIRFEPDSDSVSVSTAFADIFVPGGTLRRRAGTWTNRTPHFEVRLSAARERMSWRMSGDRFPQSFPASLLHRMILGGRFQFEDLLDFDERGHHLPEAGGSTPSFVVARGSLLRQGKGKGSFRIDGFLADPALAYEQGSSPLRIRLLDGAREVLSREFTMQGRSGVGRDPVTGEEFPRISAAPDIYDADRIRDFSYSGDTGRFRLELHRADLSTIPEGEAHLGVELTIGVRVYHTAVTFFETGGGRYSTAMPPHPVPAGK